MPRIRIVWLIFLSQIFILNLKEVVYMYYTIKNMHFSMYLPQSHFIISNI